ncbi:MAG: Hsp20/alpha crystallin family protein [Eubacteriales bacterium]
MAGLVPFNRNGLGLPVDIRGFYDLVDGFFSDSWLPARNLVFDTFKMDVKEDEKSYNIDAELPGVKKEEINLALHEGRLTISVVREENVEDKKDNYVHRERRYGSVERSIYLADANPEGIDAKLEDGLLKITVQKQGKDDRHKHIEIK